MPRFNVSMPQDLWDRVGDEAKRRADGNRSFIVRRVLEEALGTEHRDAGDESARLSGLSQAERPSPSPASPRAPEMTPVRELVDEANSVKEQKLAVLREQMANVTGDDFDLVAAGQREPAPVCEACGIDTVERQLPSGERVWVCPDCQGRVKR